MLSSVAAIMVFSFVHKAPTEEIQQNQTPTPMKPNAIRREYLKIYTAKNEDSKNQIKQHQRIQRNLDDINLVLKNVAEKYNQMEEQLKTFYSTVSHCGPENCGNLTNLLPPKSFERFKCEKIKNTKELKKRIKKYLRKILCVVQTFAEWFQQLIDSEKSSTFNQKDKEERVNLLKAFKISINTLIIEINVTDLVWSKRCKRSPRIVSNPLNEWRVIQLSRDYINGCLEQVKEMCQCKKCEKGVIWEL